MKLNSKLVALGFAAVVVTAGAIGAITMASAQTPERTPTAGTRANAKDGFLTKFAANLGVAVDQVKSAGKDAADSTVDDLLAQGKLTQDQAAKLKAKIDSGNGFGLGRLLERRKAARTEKVREGIAQSAATAIGIDVSELRTAFQNGNSIADIATQHSVSIDTVKAQITDDAKAKADAAVQSGRITQMQEDHLLQKLADKLDQIVNKRKS